MPTLPGPHAPRKHHRRGRCTPRGDYPRKKLPPAERRDRWHRWRIERAIELALADLDEHGKPALPSKVAEFLRAVLGFSDDTGSDIWASQETIGKAMGGRTATTARRWLREAERLGWAAIEHQVERRAGRWRQLHNLTRVVVPEEYACRVARKAPPKGEAVRPKAPTAPSVVEVDDPVAPVRDTPMSRRFEERARRAAGKAPPAR